MLRRKRTTVRDKKKKTKPEDVLGEEERGKSFFYCVCKVCKDQATKGHLFDEKKKVNLQILTHTQIEFVRLIEYLLATSDKIKGAQILFPDTVFFEDGKPNFIARIDKEGCLFKVT